MSKSRSNYDIIIVGAGIAGCALAHGLSTLPRTGTTSMRIAVVERSLAEPDRIVGELLQPGGVMALKSLGIEGCLEGIDAIKVNGYCVVENGTSVHIPYPGTHEGRSFHHGRFIMKLREAARAARGVDLIEATVTELLPREGGKGIGGVRVARKGKDGEEDTTEALSAALVIVADGCFSNFRSAVMGGAAVKPETKSHFVGAILKDARLPIPNHGTVALVKGFGPVLLYQISEHDTRMLVDVKAPLPADLKVCTPQFYSLSPLSNAHICRHISYRTSSPSSPRRCTSLSRTLSTPSACGACRTHSFRLSSKARRVERSFSGTRGICGTRSRVAG